MSEPVKNGLNTPYRNLTWERLSEKGRVPEGNRLICSVILRDEWNDLRSLQTFLHPPMDEQSKTWCKGQSNDQSNFLIMKNCIL